MEFPSVLRVFLTQEMLAEAAAFRPVWVLHVNLSHVIDEPKGTIQQCIPQLPVLSAPKGNGQSDVPINEHLAHFGRGCLGCLLRDQHRMLRSRAQLSEELPLP